MKILILTLLLMNCVNSPDNAEDLGLTTLEAGTNPNVSMEYNWTLTDKYLVSHTSAIVKSWSNETFRFYDSTQVIITAKPEGSLRSNTLTLGRHYFIQDTIIIIMQVDYIQSGLKLKVKTINKLDYI